MKNGKPVDMKARTKTRRSSVTENAARRPAASRREQTRGPDESAAREECKRIRAAR